MSEQFTVTGRILFSTEGFERGLTRAGKKLKSFGQQATRAGRDLTTSVSLPLALAGAAAIKTATSFELAQRKIQALNPKNNIGALTKSARELGANTIFTAEQVSQLQLSLAKLGKSDSEIQALQSTVLKFAQAMDQDLATSGEFLVKTMNRYADSLANVGDTQAQAAYVGNLFASVAANTALDAEKLAASLNYVGSEAAVYGLALEDTAAILGLLADRGFEASRGGTALRRILAQLGKDGYTASEAIEQLLDPTKGFSEELEQFGLRGAGPAAALGGLKEEFEELRKTISNSNGFLNEFALILDTSLSASFKRVKSAAEEVSIAFVEDFAKSIRIATDNISRLLRKFAELPKPIKAVIVGLGLFLAIAGPLLLIVGSLTAAIGALLLAGASLTALLTGGLVVALGAAVAATVLLTENTDTTSMSMDELRRKAYNASEALKEVSKQEFVKKEELAKIVEYQNGIDYIERRIVKLQKQNIGSSNNRSIERAFTALEELKKVQKDYADQVERAAKQRAKDREEAERFARESGAMFFGAFPGQGTGKKTGSDEEIDSRSIKELLQQRLELLNRIKTIQNEALSKGKTGVFDSEALKAANSELKTLEELLKLVGITFEKTEKEKALPFTENLRKEFLRLNPEIGAIIDNQLRYAAAIEKLKRVQETLNFAKAAEFQATGKVNEDTEKALVMNKALLEFYQLQLKAVGGVYDKTQQIGFLINTLEETPVVPTEKELKRMALLKEQMTEVKDLALAIGNTFASVISTAFADAIEGTKSFGESLIQNLLSALQRVLAKVLALIAAFIVLNILSGGMFAGSGFAAGAKEALGGMNMGQFLMSGMNMGSLRSSSGGGLRVEGVLSGSDVVLSSRRGATALDRIYG